MPKMFGFLMKDLSKAFDWSDKKLPIAIIHTNGFDIKSIKFIDNYLARKKQDKNELIFQWVEWGSLWSTAGINIESPHHVRILYRRASQKLNIFLRYIFKSCALYELKSTKSNNEGIHLFSFWILSISFLFRYKNYKVRKNIEQLIHYFLSKEKCQIYLTIMRNMQHPGFM